ncbi:hypothetical protein FRB94_011586 [Tulasnella sp. JGI-2019a]|nr:hypothetical protein FRB93_009919 [Tulasnella sp. JGI-2019a]KAG8992482.1 hypothetical protein FRB94_011586 [Tulasnella sp. JGI-2019a]KAG9024745.1 hypothetical protein FRB95_011137 [Tulasnella sp. JGI-2019a]
MGVFSTPGVVVNATGSIGLAFVLWLVGALVAFSGLTLYIELGSRFPNRSGGDAVFLEQAYPYPRYFMPTVFAICSVILGSTAVSATVFAQYTMHALDIVVTPWRQKWLAVAMLSFCLAICAASNRVSFRIINALGFIKIASMAFIICTGIAVLSGLTSIKDPAENLKRPFEGSNWGANALVTGLIKIDYTFNGWSSAIVFLSEVQADATTGSLYLQSPHTDPVNLVRRASYAALAFVTVIFLFINIAYFAAIPKETLSQSGSLVGAMFCESVYGVDSFVAKRLFPLMVTSSCVGLLIATTLYHARIVRETSRQGVLPFPEILSSTWPFGTPAGPILVQWVLSVLVIVLPPAKEAFEFLIDSHIYPTLVFGTLSALAVWILRARSPQAGKAGFRAWNGFVVIYLVKCVMSLIMPWIPPQDGSHHGNGGMWYAMYCVVGVVLVLFSILYYIIWMILLPRLGGYEMVQETVTLAGGALTNRFRKVSKRDMDRSEGDEEDTAPLLQE